jgi:hypothetical protein
VHSIRHLIACHHLAARGVTGNNDRAKIREDVLIREFPQNLIDELE